eukprot:354021-Chlamydomonas_euryale.AAC.4
MRAAAAMCADAAAAAGPSPPRGMHSVHTRHTSQSTGVGSLSFLTATTRLRFLSMQRHTAPYAPSLILDTNSYFSIATAARDAHERAARHVTARRRRRRHAGGVGAQVA